MTDSSGMSQYTYDLQDRLLTYGPPAPSGHSLIFYTYNALGQKKSVMNGSLVVNYDYYANGWLKRVRNGTSLVSKYTLDVAGNRTRVDLGNTDYTTYGYDTDPRYRVSSVMHYDASNNLLVTPGILYASRDGAGNPLSMQDWNGTTAYTYDVYNRLGAVTDYDWVGNRNPATWTYNAVDQLTATASNQYTYLMTGSLSEQKDGLGVLQKTYTYTYANLLSTVTHTGVPNPSAMTWDADSNRISFTSSQGGTTQFVYDTTAGIPAVIEEVLPDTSSVYYIREPNGSLIARMAGITGANIRYYHFDALGSTKLLTDSLGAVTDKYTYDAWGALTNHERLTGSVDQPYQFVGQLGYYTHYQDTNLPMLQLGVRFYDREIGRFTQADRIQRPGPDYTYADDQPMEGVDPTGLLRWPPGQKGKCPNLPEAMRILASTLQKPSCMIFWELLMCSQWWGGDPFAPGHGPRVIVADPAWPGWGPQSSVAGKCGCNGDPGPRQGDIVINRGLCQQKGAAHLLAQALVHESAHWCVCRQKRMGMPRHPGDGDGSFPGRGEGHAAIEACFGGE